MTDKLRVIVVFNGAKKKFYSLRWFDPMTGRRRYKSAGTANRKQADKAAAVLEAELREGRYAKPSGTTWDDFRERYETEALPALAPRTAHAWRAVANHVERILSPRKVADLTGDRLSFFQAQLRTKKPKPLRDSSIATHLAHLKAALSWAVRVGMIREVPKVQKPKRNLGGGMMRGRPVTGEEFDRMLAKVPDVRPKDVARWEHYLTGLWLSGLRLEESLRLTWDADGEFSVDLGGRYPRFRIYAEAEKGHRNRLLPMTPDFAEWLLETPDDERYGLVFKLGATSGRQRSAKRVCRTVGDIGRLAGVVVNREQEKFASAHDLRRSFATRWAGRVKPATLQLLMRHSSIDTTLRYYVAQDADDVAAELWAGHGHNAPFAVRTRVRTDVTRLQNVKTSDSTNADDFDT
jgi:integrase